MNLIHPAGSSLSMLLRDQASARPDAVAILAPGRPALTYAGLLTQVEQIACALRSHDVAPSARVAIVLPNGPEMATAFLGVAACAICVPLNPNGRAADYRSSLAQVRAQAVVLHQSESGPARVVAREMGLVVLEVESDARQPAGRFRIGPATGLHVGRPRTAGPPDIALILSTSGTTALPKIVPISQACLVSWAREVVRTFALSPADCCLNVMPLFHITALVGNVVATLASGGSVVCAPGLDGEAFFDWIAQYRPTWLSAVPTMHQWLIAHGALYRQKAPKHRFRFVRSSAAPLAPATFHRLEALLGAPVIESYGMTERTPIAINPMPPGLRKPGSVGLPAGVEIALLDDAGWPAPAGAAGEIALRGQGVISAYENDPDASAHALVGGWFRTGDLGRFDADGYLYITGRSKEIVNRGGEKVSPREVDDALLEHPAVAQAASFAIAHPTLGEELAAAVVLRNGALAEESALRGFLLERLAAYKVPSRIVFVDALPVSGSGKVRRSELREKFDRLLAKDFVDATTDTQRSLEAIFRDVLGCAPIGLHDSFFNLGGDSLSGARVVARVYRRHGVALDVAALFRHPSVAELARAVDAARRVGEAQADELAAEIAQLDDDEVARLLTNEGVAAR
jgi:acyl-CoA synthetase (AMP-forming)/AMP-acid ligase II